VPHPFAGQYRPSVRVEPAPPKLDKAGLASLRPGALPYERWWFSYWPMVLLFSVIGLAAILLRWLLRSPHAVNSEFIGELVSRLRIWLIGPQQIEDSKFFADALNIWHEVLVSHNPTPRTIKAFQNRLRYFASRMGENLEDKRQAHLVALCVANFAYEDSTWLMERMDKSKVGLELEMEFENLASASEKNSAVSDKEHKQYSRKQLLLSVLLKHLEKFGSLPDESDRKFFHVLVEDIEIHKQE